MAKHQPQQRQEAPAPAGRAPLQMVVPRCGDCQCYLPPEARPGADPMALATQGLNKGECFRFPETVRKHASDHCFEFLAKTGDPDAR